MTFNTVYYLTLSVFAYQTYTQTYKAFDSFDPLTYVEPRIGTLNGGHVFAGATLPYGMAKASPDVTVDNAGGFSPNGSPITGFSHMHDSGTGGKPSLGTFPISIQTNCTSKDIKSCNFGSKLERAVYPIQGSDHASPGYFAISLDDGVHAEMTVTQHTALYRFHIPQSGPIPVSPLILLDLSDLADSQQGVSVSVDEKTGRMKGRGVFLPSFGTGSYTSFVCVDYLAGELSDSGIFFDGNPYLSHEVLLFPGSDNNTVKGGGLVRFSEPAKDNILMARVGLSFNSSERACENAEKEIPNWDFDQVKTAAEAVWSEKLGNVVASPGGHKGFSIDRMKNFYSGIYRTMISPQNYTGENVLRHGDSPYFDSFYCIWDSFRTQHPLLTIVDPKAQTEMIHSLLDIYRSPAGNNVSEAGADNQWLPDCRMSFSEGFTQGGSNVDVVLADYKIKLLPQLAAWDEHDYTIPYAAARNDAENQPGSWTTHGRGDLDSWKSLGYIPVDDISSEGGIRGRSISRTLEYAYDDYSVSRLVPEHLVQEENAVAKYLNRSGNWRNLWRPDMPSTITYPNGTNETFVGFPQPRFQDGSWGHQDPQACSMLRNEWCSLTANSGETYEAPIWVYQFYVPHAMSSLIKLMGGRDDFVRRLDALHETGLVDIGNEPSFLTVFQYHYAGRPGLSSKRARSYINSRFYAGPAGVPGNDDSGAYGAFTAFAMAGLFPVAGQGVYLITAPFFQYVQFTNPLNAKVATIVVENHEEGNDQKVFIQKATLDGKPYSKNWISHEFFARGGTLKLCLGLVESQWGTALSDVPPSVEFDVEWLLKKDGQGLSAESI